MKNKIDPYNVKIENTRVDPYLVCQLFGITDFPIAEAIKKLLRLGRKHKNKRKDVEEAVLSLQRWLEIQPTPPDALEKAMRIKYNEQIQPPTVQRSSTASKCIICDGHGCSVCFQARPE